MGLNVFAILLALVLLMAIAYRGLPVILFAPLCALLAAGLSGRPVLPTYTETFMASAAGYVRSFFPLFLLGAVFGKLMETSGAAGTIAGVIARTLGPRQSILAVVLACGVLTYGGVSLFVVAFAVYPFAAALFREADIPKRLIPGAIALGAFTLTMDALPGSPQILNLIPTRYFGTDTYAAPWTGTLGGVDDPWGRPALAGASPGAGGVGRRGVWDGPHERARRRARDASTTPRRRDPAAADRTGRKLRPEPDIRGRWRPGTPASLLKRDFPSADAAVAAPTWALIVALLLGSATALAVGAWRRWGELPAALSAATMGALLAIFNTASEVGFGNTVKSLPGFRSIQDQVFFVSRHVLLSEATAINVLAGITGSASGGLSIALEVMGQRYLEIAQAQGISPELLHRIAAMSAGGMDTLPHNGAVITLLAVTGLTHRQSYLDILAITVLKTVTVFTLAFAASVLR